MKQSQAVYQATKSVCEDNGVHFEDGMNAADIVTKEMRASIYSILCEGFKSGTIDLADTESNRAKLSNDAELRKYVSGLVNNWFRKDTRMNGGGKYTPKNPGSRAGQTDPEVKQLRLLLKSGQLNEEQAHIVQARLDERVAELSAKSQPKIDFSVLPAELREQLGINE
jgi:hypothetical protein